MAQLDENSDLKDLALTLSATLEPEPDVILCPSQAARGNLLTCFSS